MDVFSVGLLRGAYGHPMGLSRRALDGVRGVFLRAPVKRGDLLLSVPLSYCFLPRGLQRSCLQTEATPTVAMHVRRYNRGKTLFPEFWAWLQRLSPDAPGGSVSLSSNLSEGGSVHSVTLSPVEASLTVSVALRYFFGPGLGLPPAATQRLQRVRESSLPTADSRCERLTERYTTSLPMNTYLSHGVESLFTTDGGRGAEHACLEQLSYNLRDACLTYASPEQYRWMDENPSILDNILLAALYVVRARIISIPLLSTVDARLDREVEVLAPGLDLLNHAPDGVCTAVAAIAPIQGAIVVRAVRTAGRGEEVTITYKCSDGNDFASRYLLGENQISLGSTF